MRALNLKTLSLIIALAIGLTSCGSSSKKSTSSSSDDSSMGTDMGSEGLNFELNGDSDSGKAGSLRTVYFDFNSANLGSETRSALDANAEALKSNSNVKVQIEGHCDERGGVQYNLALGEQRAKAVRQYLISAGVSSSQMSTISFGKERPVSFGHDEMSWSKNRRANFVVTGN